MVFIYFYIYWLKTNLPQGILPPLVQLSSYVELEIDAPCHTTQSWAHDEGLAPIP